MDWFRARLKGALGETLVRGTDFLLPPSCFSCGSPTSHQGDLCAGCWGDLQFITAPFCASCGLPFEFDVAHIDAQAHCGACIAVPPSFNRARSPLLYDDASKKLIIGLKHADQLEGVPAFARMMWRTLGRENGATDHYDLVSGVDLIIPVPLHPARLWRRRYNQSALLARGLAQLISVPLDVTGLVRVRRTPSQGHMDRTQRLKNVKGAFRVTSTLAKNLEGKSVMLIDDVMTSGATVGECARVLRKSGAEKINVLTLARVARSA